MRVKKDVDMAWCGILLPVTNHINRTSHLAGSKDVSCLITFIDALVGDTLRLLAGCNLRSPVLPIYARTSVRDKQKASKKRLSAGRQG